MQIAQRLDNLPTYVFAAIAERIRALKAEGVDVIRCDIGSPDLPPPPAVVETLYRSAKDPSKHGYAGFLGTPEFRQAIAAYYDRRFGVELDPESEVLPLIGSKEGIFHTPMAFTNPGDVVLAPDPGYPTYRMATLLMGAELHLMPLRVEKGYLPDLEEIPEDVLSRAKVMWLNYPSNPTTAVAGLPFLAQVVEFAREHDILVAYDNPYADVTWDGLVAPSILEVTGARDVVLEFNSFSKVYNMAGWRVGMAVGGPEAIAAMARLKTNVDSGIFRPVQDAAIAALETDPGWIAQRNAAYKERRQVVTQALERMGMRYTPSSATLYVWAAIPEGRVSADFCAALLESTGVSISPGSAFGPHGEGYVRVTLGQPVDRMEEAMARWEQWLGG